MRRKREKGRDGFLMPGTSDPGILKSAGDVKSYCSNIDLKFNDA